VVLVHIKTVLTQVVLSHLLHTAFSLDTEQPDYDLDSEDEAFVNKLKKKMDVGALQFEEMIDRLEKGSGQQVPEADRTGNSQNCRYL